MCHCLGDAGARGPCRWKPYPEGCAHFTLQHLGRYRGLALSWKQSICEAQSSAQPWGAEPTFICISVRENHEDIEETFPYFMFLPSPRLPCALPSLQYIYLALQVRFWGPLSPFQDTGVLLSN